jgi:hypothetical protein
MRLRVYVDVVELFQYIGCAGSILLVLVLLVWLVYRYKVVRRSQHVD